MLLIPQDTWCRRKRTSSSFPLFDSISVINGAFLACDGLSSQLSLAISEYSVPSSFLLRGLYWYSN